MQKETFVCLILSTIFVFNAFAQSTVISGQVVDAESKTGLPYATVTLTAKESGEQVAETLSDEDGRFSFAGLPPGEYAVNCSFAGYEISAPALSGKPDRTFDPGKIELARQTGLHGDAGLFFGLGALGKRRADLPGPLGSYGPNPKFVPSLNLHYKTSRTAVALQTEMIRQKGIPDNEFVDLYLGDAAYISQVPDNRIRTHYAVKGSVRRALNDRNMLAVSGIYRLEDRTDTAQAGFFDRSTMRPVRYRTWKEREKLVLADVSVAFKHRFAEAGHELNAAFDCLYGNNDNAFGLHELSSVFIGRHAVHLTTRERMAKITADYAEPLRDGYIKARIEGRTLRSLSDYDSGGDDNSIVYPGIGDRSERGEDLVSLSAEWALDRRKFETKIALRAEYVDAFYDLSADNVYYPADDRYRRLDLFPDVRLTRKIGKHNRLSLSYDRDVDRPVAIALRIYPDYTNPGMIKAGNPYLRPQYTQHVALTHKYGWKSGSASISGYYKTVKAPYSRIFVSDTESGSRNLIDRVFANIGKIDNIGGELTAEQRLGKYWKLSGYVNIYRNSIAAYTGTLYFPYEQQFTVAKSTSRAWSAKVDNRVNIGKNGRLQLSGVYFAPRNIPSGRRFGFGGIDFAFVQSFLHGKFELTVSMSDVLNTMGIREELQNTGFRAIYENYYETQVVGLGAKCRF